MCRVCLLPFPSTAGARLIISLSAGRSLRSLGYAHTRAAQLAPSPLRSPAPPFDTASLRVPPSGAALLVSSPPRRGGEGRGEVGGMPSTSPGMTRLIISLNAGAPSVALRKATLISPCPPSALSGRRRRKAPTPPSVPLRLSAGRGTGGAGPGCQAARRSRDMKEKKRGQATAVTVPRVPRGGGRLSRSARWPMRVRAAQMFRLRT